MQSSTYKLLGEVLDELEIRKITGDTIHPGMLFRDRAEIGLAPAAAS